MKKEVSSMIVIPPKKIKSKGDTIQMFLAGQDKFKTFYRDVRATLKETQHACLKEGHESDPRKCVHSGYHDWPDSVPFRRFNHYRRSTVHRMLLSGMNMNPPLVFPLLL